MDILTKIDNFVRMLAANPYISFTGFLIGIASLIYALYIASRDKKVKLLRYFTGSSNLIENGSNLYPRLDVTYDGRKLDNFTVTKLSIKNKGTEIIRPEDIVKNDPIRVSVNSEKNVELLEFAVTRISDKNNNFYLIPNTKNSFDVLFDFIEPNDSVTIQILHTGNSSQDIVVSGTVIGAKKPFTTRDYVDSSPLLTSIFPRLYKSAIRLLIRMPTKVLNLITSVLGMILFVSLARYFFLKSNVVLTLLCSIPSALFILLVIVIIFTRSDPEQEALTHERIRNMLMHVIPTDEQQTDN